MPNQITLTITEGEDKGKKYYFESRTTCIIGRDKNCNIVIPEEYSTISRYHCLLDINPPEIIIRDIGSKNGTYINNQLIGKREENQEAEDVKNINLPEYDLKDNDMFQMGDDFSFKVNIVNNDTIKSSSSDRNIHNQIKTPKVAPGNKNTIFNIGDRGSHSPNKKFNFRSLIDRLLQLANRGEARLKAIQGYTIMKKLGEGGCGEVYLVREDKTEELFALKVMLPKIAAQPNKISQFRREIGVAKFLDHPNLVRLKDYCVSDGLFFFVMEYCSEGTICNAMEKKGGRLQVKIALKYIYQVLDGLHYAHEKGIVHRDIKPDNIFIHLTEDEKFIIKLGDYGLAKPFDNAGLSGLTLTGSKQGHPVFMSRKQILNFKYVKPDVDVWAVAATLYYMLTGQFTRDFGTSDPLEVILKYSPVPILQRGVDIPKPLARVIDFALEDNLDEFNFKSATEFKEALLKAMN